MFFSRAGLQALEKKFFFSKFENTLSQLSNALSSAKKSLKLANLGSNAFCSQKQLFLRGFGANSTFSNRQVLKYSLRIRESAGNLTLAAWVLIEVAVSPLFA